MLIVQLQRKQTTPHTNKRHNNVHNAPHDHTKHNTGSSTTSTTTQSIPKAHTFLLSWAPTDIIITPNNGPFMVAMHIFTTFYMINNIMINTRPQRITHTQNPMEADILPMM